MQRNLIGRKSLVLMLFMLAMLFILMVAPKQAFAADATKTSDTSSPYIIYVEKTGDGVIYANNEKLSAGNNYFTTGSVLVVASPAAKSFTYEVATGAATVAGSAKEGYSFTFTTGATLNFTAKFEEESSDSDGGSSSTPAVVDEFPFTDVPKSDWGYDAIKWLWKQGGTEGVDPTTYAPNWKLTRGMAVEMLYRLAGKPAAGTSSFSDVDADAYYAKAVAWAAANGIVEGTTPTTFRPERYITREEFAAILYRYEQTQGKGFTGTWMFDLKFDDADSVSEYAYESICWMTMNNVLEGYDDNTVRPQNNISRRETAVMLYRLWSL
ncbi:MAG: S-layer homology domain-containing protein [Firmicutes bacterium]|nr:S-layer homology domain-containing protein [Bacillota bacterium]